MKKKILLVDDIKEFRSLVKIILSGNYDVVTAADGEDALKKIEKGLSPDVIVTDLIMPRVDGYQLINKIMSGGSYRNIPVIVLSNIDGAAERKALEEQGVSGYIIKPFNTEELREELSQSLSSVFDHSN